MSARARTERDVVEQPPAPATRVNAYESRPGRFVFVEDGNTDGWIATEHVVDLQS